MVSGSGTVSQTMFLARRAGAAGGQGQTMTEKITRVNSMPKEVKSTISRSEVEQPPVRELVKVGRARGEDVTSRAGC